MEIAAILKTIQACKYSYANEEELQTGLAQALEDAGCMVRREVRLDYRNRIDLLVDEIGIEVKVDGKPDAVLRQLERYAYSPNVRGLILVTTRVRHRMPKLINGKPIVVVSLASAGL
jgi:hypothetical protein